MEQIFFILLVAIVGAVRLLMQVAEKKKNAEAEKRSVATAPNTAPAPASMQSEEERVRKFFEALGVPTSTTPPPRVQPRQVAPKKPRGKRLIDPFPKPRTSGPSRLPIPSLSDSPPELTSSSGAPAVTLQEPTRIQTAVADFEVRDTAEATDSLLLSTQLPSSAPQGIAARLATVEGLREAFVLREILGAPRSMQPFSYGTPG